LLDIFLIYVLIKNKPYKEKIFHYRDLLVETAYIAIHLTSICIYKEISSRELLATIVVYSCWIILGSHTFCLFYETIKIIKFVLRKKNDHTDTKQSKNIQD
jgi:hypothetical protein